jgi:hypothetical protein
MDGFPSAESVDLLKQLDVAYVLVDSSRYDIYADVDQAIQSLGLKLAHVTGTDYIYVFP